MPREIPIELSHVRLEFGASWVFVEVVKKKTVEVVKHKMGVGEDCKGNKTGGGLGFRV